MTNHTLYVVAEANNINTAVCVSRAFGKIDNAKRHLKRCYNRTLAACENCVSETECSDTSYCITTLGNDLFYGEIREIEARY